MKPQLFSHDWSIRYTLNLLEVLISWCENLLPPKKRRVYLRRPGPAFEAVPKNKQQKPLKKQARTQKKTSIPTIQVRTVSFREGSKYPLICTNGPIFRGFRFRPTKGESFRAQNLGVNCPAVSFGGCTGVPPGKVETYPTKREVGKIIDSKVLTGKRRC